MTNKIIFMLESLEAMPAFVYGFTPVFVLIWILDDYYMKNPCYTDCIGIFSPHYASSDGF